MFWIGFWCGLFFFLGTLIFIYSGLTDPSYRRVGGDNYPFMVAVILLFDAVSAWLMVKGRRTLATLRDVFANGPAVIGMVENAWLQKQSGSVTHMTLQVGFHDARGRKGLIKGRWPIASVPGDPGLWGTGASVVVLYDPMDLSRAAAYPLDYQGLPANN
jgi:hypothetical protein